MLELRKMVEILEVSQFSTNIHKCCFF